MDKYKGLLDLVVICVWLLGTIGGFGYLWYIDEHIIAAGVAGLAFEALPVLWSSLREMLPKSWVDFIEKL